jgi:hypothetical protein
MMGKWKLNSLYINGYADFLNGRTNEIEIYKLIDYNVSIKYDSEIEEDIIYDIQLTLINIKTTEEIIIDQDDRYGKYPLLNKKRKKDIENKLYEYQYIVEKLDNIVKLW